MYFNKLLLWGLAIFFSTVQSDGTSAVVDLTSSNFDDLVLNGKPSFIEFFAPWCGHCKALAPDWEKLAQDFAFAQDKIVIAKVDAQAEKSLGSRFGIQGFPTIKFFDGKSETPEDYNGGRDLESLTEFVEGKTGVRTKKTKAPPSHVLILDDSSFKSEISSNKDVFVAFTSPRCGHCKKLAPTWEQIAEDFSRESDVVIAKVDAQADNSKDTAKDQEINSYPTIKFYAKGTIEPETYKGGRTEEEFVTYLNEKTGTHREPGGGLDATAGTIENLDSLISELIDGSDIKKVSEKVTKAASTIDESIKYNYASYYVRILQKLVGTKDFATTELARLSKILQKGGLAPEKYDEFTIKTNILRKFSKKSSEKSEL
ncbi:Protein disulfide-isomerase tigA [Golovinomyces cichoracearum]|uniref:protein disulfide-isomerase n=1 Tax=Golovinomyces cichoracearum TaxID=62708 RepID=A0A420IE44_9PEZI|nr:Protein disulfide-isomerase tigA [Golovinomyces cichoracearum]